PMAPVDRLLRADRPSQTVPPAACPHQRAPIAPSWPPRIIAVTSEIRTGQPQELFFEVPLSRSGRLIGLLSPNDLRMLILTASSAAAAVPSTGSRTFTRTAPPAVILHASIPERSAT